MSQVESERPRRRRAETVERLLDAALETFAEIGFAAATVEDVCRRGGFTRGAFYSSFRTKDELFAALFARETARRLELTERQLAGIEQEADPVTAAVDRCLVTLRADRTWVLVQTEYRLHAARSPEAAAALREHTAALHARLTDLVTTACARTGLHLALPADRLARLVLALHEGIAVQQAVDDDGAPTTTHDGAHPDDGTAFERAALLHLLRSVVSDRPPT